MNVQIASTPATPTASPQASRPVVTYRTAGEHARPTVVAGLAFFLLLAGTVLPTWTMTLHAPQYPRGLRLIIDGRGPRGDVGELNALNHYIGMAPLPDDRRELPELPFFIPGVAALALGMALVPFVSGRWFRTLVTLGSWVLPLGFLADLQWRLYVFGHSLSPEAAFRLPAFTPMVLGPTVVMNFNVTAAPGPGLILFALSALVLTMGPRLRLGGRLRRQAAVASVSGLVLMLAGAVIPA
ncbi:MAG: hypothetical protein ACRDGN_09610, partial [bacterium]